ncbi:DUF3515 family protein [Herbiconiux sp. L3-i23]|uniref:DUF3515 family protein n=1 Tax=Herbiconiux sp. L3-i23 TaxID=2905871 RepID=UPI00206D99DF|nr:DUF3515 family protein [Herbiconiux sp. L3-i23]BDI21830.1 hypothetical protein L3i23_06060 [Herbiconiux sp. L3-i23]
MPSRPLRLISLSAGIVGTILVAALTGCTPTVSMTAAENAADPDCAAVSVRLPDTLDDQPLRETNAQATGAWGEPASVLLRCGVASPGPTTDRCISISGVDWVEDSTDAPVYRYTTYGRTPTTEVVIDSEKASGTDVLTDLSGIVGLLPADGACVGAADVEIPESE